MVGNVRNPPSVPAHLVARVHRIVPARSAAATAEIVKNPPSVPAQHAALARRIVPLRSAVATVVTVKNPLNALDRHVARDQMTVRIPPSTRVRRAAQALATAPGREIALPAPRIAQAHRVVQVLPDVPDRQVAAARKNPVAGVLASLAEELRYEWLAQSIGVCFFGWFLYLQYMGQFILIGFASIGVAGHSLYELVTGDSDRPM